MAVNRIGTRDPKAPGHIERTTLRDVKVGDVILLEDGQQIPADCVVLKVVNSNGSTEGYIQTAQLDGERNLKPKMPVRTSQQRFDDWCDGRVQFSIHCEQPSPNLYFFDGKLSVAESGSEQTFALGLPNFVPRGALVKNCQMYAVVCYTGKDSKIILNQGHYKYKHSSYDKKLNYIFIFQICSVLFLCSILAFCYNAALGSDPHLPQYDINEKNKPKVIGLGFLSFFLICMRLVPLDLIFNLEIGKLVVSKYIKSDADLLKLDRESGEIIPCRVQSMQLPEELGNIDHIFCDKTGTLTKNELVFRQISFGGTLCKGKDVQDTL